MQKVQSNAEAACRKARQATSSACMSEMRRRSHPRTRSNIRVCALINTSKAFATRREHSKIGGRSSFSACYNIWSNSAHAEDLVFYWRSRPTGYDLLTYWPSYMLTPHEASETPHICYAMAYFLLPMYCAERPDALLQNLRAGPRAGAVYFYLRTCQIKEIGPRDEVVPFLSVSTGKLDDTTTYHIITYPTPPPIDLFKIPADKLSDRLQEFVLAPYFSAVLEKSETHEIAYFILGQSPDGFTTLRTVTGTVNANLGPGCEPKLESFVELLRARTKARK